MVTSVGCFVALLCTLSINIHCDNNGSKQFDYRMGFLYLAYNVGTVNIDDY